MAELKKFIALFRRNLKQDVPILAENREKAIEALQKCCEECDTSFIWEDAHNESKAWFGEVVHITEPSDEKFEKLQEEVQTILPDGSHEWRQGIE